MTNFRRIFLIAFIVIVVLNFGYALLYHITPGVDAEAYDEIAVNLTDHGVYQSTLGVDPKLDASIARVGPGYEFFLAGIYSIFGRNLQIVWFIQAVLYAFTVILLTRLALLVKPELSARPKLILGTMIFFGILIDAVQLNAMLMTETLSIFLMALALYLFGSQLIRGRTTVRSGVMTGLSLGVLTMVRPNGLLLLILFVIAAIVRGRRALLPYVLAMVLVFGAVQVPWIIRNYHVFGTFVFNTTAGGWNILSGNYPGNHGEFTVDFPLFKKLKEQFPSPIELSQAAKHWYRDFVFHEPLHALGILIEKFIIFFALTKTSGFWFHYYSGIDQGLTILLSIIQNGLIFGGLFIFLLGIFMRFRDTKKISRRELFIIFAILALIAIPVLTVIANRHRLPLAVLSLPILLIVVSEIRDWSKRNLIKTAAVAALLLIASTSVDLALQFDKFQGHLGKFFK